MTRVVLTSFEPFAGHALNSSLEVGRKVAEQSLPGIDLTWLVLPVVAGQCAERAWAKIEEISPDLVLSLGQAGAAKVLHIERLAVNIHHFYIPDNVGNRWEDEPIHADGPPAYFTTIPAKRVVHDLKAAGLPAELSYSAGTYVCNHLLYSLLHRAAVSGRNPGIGFIHLPLLPEQHAKKATERPLELEQLTSGIRLAIGTCAAVPGS